MDTILIIIAVLIVVVVAGAIIFVNVLASKKPKDLHRCAFCSKESLYSKDIVATKNGFSYRSDLGITYLAKTRIMSVGVELICPYCGKKNYKTARIKYYPEEAENGKLKEKIKNYFL